MNMIIKKRQLITATLVIALASAVFINWYYTKPDVKPTNNDTVASKTANENVENLGDAKYVNSSTAVADSKNAAESTNAADYFTTAKTKRTKAHDEAKDVLNATAQKDGGSSPAAKAAAQELSKLANIVKQEVDIENLVNAKTGKKCIVVINNGKAEVVMEKGALSGAVATQIKDIVMKQANLKTGDITIIELK